MTLVLTAVDCGWTQCSKPHHSSTRGSQNLGMESPPHAKRSGVSWSKRPPPVCVCVGGGGKVIFDFPESGSGDFSESGVCGGGNFVICTHAARKIS